MPWLIKIISPILMKLAELTFGVVIKTISGWIDDYMAKKKEENDNREIDRGIKDPNRTGAARRIDDVFRGQK